MAGYHRYTAVLDACVLYPVSLRDLLLTLSVDGVYGARWTDQIQNEWMRNLLTNRPDLSPHSLARTASLMNGAIEDSRIINYEYLIDSLTLPDRPCRISSTGWRQVSRGNPRATIRPNA